LISLNEFLSSNERVGVDEKSDKKLKRKTQAVKAPPTSLPLASSGVDTEAFNVFKNRLREQLGSKDIEGKSSLSRFVNKTLDEVKSGQQRLDDTSSVAGHKDEAPVCIFVRGDKEISISTSPAEGSMYVAGEISTLAWASFEAFARGAWHMLVTALKIDLDEISFSHGILISDTKFCLAAKFELDPRNADALCSAVTQRRISTCTALLSNSHLWNDAELKKNHADPEDFDLIVAVQNARQEISTKELPFNCLFESDLWVQPFGIPKGLATRRPPEASTKNRCETGKSTGYCSERRLFHFKILQSNTLENISFDEDEFFDNILAVSGKACPLIEVHWEEKFEDKAVISRTLKGIKIVMDVLC